MSGTAWSGLARTRPPAGGSRFGSSAALVATCCFAAATLGCASVVHSGKPPGSSPPDLHERWRHGFAFGLIDAERTPNLDHVCRHGWATIEHRISFLNGLVGFLNSFVIYTPSTLTVVCAAPPVASQPEGPGWPPAAPSSSAALPPPRLPR